MGYVAGMQPASFSSSGKLALRQAEIVSDPIARLRCARKMYELRYDGENVFADVNSVDDMRLTEGRRMKEQYQSLANKHGVAWVRRKPGEGVLNTAIDIANTCLYGVVEVVVNALGLSSALGVIHTGNTRSFVFDIADLFKHGSIDVAFACVASGRFEPTEVRGAVSRWLRQEKIIEAVISGIVEVFGMKEPQLRLISYRDANQWWDESENDTAGTAS